MKTSCVISLLAIAACSHSDAGTEAGIWLDQWEVTRHCLIPADAEDTRTALAIAELSGKRDCSTHLTALAAVAGPDVRAAVATIQAGERVAASIDRIDAAAAQLQLGVGTLPLARPRRVLPGLKRGSTIDVAGAPVPSSARLSTHRGSIEGRIDQGESVVDFVVRSRTHVDHIERPAHGAAYFPITDLYAHRKDIGDRRIAGALQAGPKQIIVAEGRRDDVYPYRLYLTGDDGEHWDRWDGPEGWDLVGASQDPLTGTTDLLVRAPEVSSKQGRRGGQIHVMRLAIGNGFWTAAFGDRVVWTPPASLTARPIARIECRHADVMWTFHDGRLERFGPGTGTRIDLVERPAGPRRVDCRRDTALVHTPGPDRLERCSEVCEQVLAARHARPGVSALLDDGSWIYAAELDGVLGIWRDGAPPAFHRLAATGTLHAIGVLDGRPHLVVAERNAFRLVSLPVASR